MLLNVELLKEVATTSSEPAALVQSYSRELGGPKMSEAFVGQCATNKKERSPALAKITHLTMNDKRLSRMENLHRCQRLQILYLYDNRITRIESLASCPALSILYLQNNLINQISGLEGLTSLKKL